MNRAITVIWLGMLIATTVGIVPVIVRLLSRTLAAANNIERYTKEILTSGVGIADNTVNVAALKETISVAPQLLSGATAIKQHAAVIRRSLGKVGANVGEVRS